MNPAPGTHAREKVVVGMSGGVDSSVAAWLLLRAGYRVEGLFMDNWDEDDAYCSSARDYQDARRVCGELEIPLHRVHLAAEYRERVFAHFLAEYRAGRTPNPDVLCNREIKFDAFLRHAERLGADRIATGHYARLATGTGGPRLLRAADRNKDQTYFLHAVPAQAFAKALFPLGGLDKREVRELAVEAGFHNFDKQDSTGICFIGERPFREFLARYLPAEPGEIVSDDGHVVGRHAGLMYYTLGQREGLGIGGVHGRPDAPWYVIGKEFDRNRLVVGQGHDHPALFSSALVTGAPHWIGSAPAPGARLSAQVRYRQPPQPCRLQHVAAGAARVEFDQPQRAVAPGQYAVLYDGDECLGGGVIEATEAEHQPVPA